MFLFVFSGLGFVGFGVVWEPFAFILLSFSNNSVDIKLIISPSSQYTQVLWMWQQMAIQMSVAYMQYKHTLNIRLQKVPCLNKWTTFHLYEEKSECNWIWIWFYSQPASSLSAKSLFLHSSKWSDFRNAKYLLVLQPFKTQISYRSIQTSNFMCVHSC